MSQATPRQDAHAAARDGSIASEARELADFLSGQDPLDAEAALWAARRQDGLNAAEEAELQAWLDHDPARGARLEELSDLLGQLDQLPPDDVSALRARLPQPVHLSQPSGQPPSAPRSGTRQAARHTWLAGLGRLVPQAVATGLALLVMGTAWLGWHQWQQQPSFTQSYVTQRGQQLTAALPEGSALRLDTDTRLDVSLYRHQRVLHLPQGQALFDVRPDATKPFHVMAGPMRITVLGTRFSVRHVHDAAGTGPVRVVVEEGRVRVTRIDAQHRDSADSVATAVEAVVLTAGQAVEADNEGNLSPVSAASMPADMAWRSGRLELDDTPLGEAVAEFERYTDTGLVIADPSVAALRLNGSFDVRQVQAFRRALPQALPVRLVPRPHGRYEVVPVD